MAAFRVLQLLILLSLFLNNNANLSSDEEFNPFYSLYTFRHVEIFSAYFLPKNELTDNFSHLRVSRKKALVITKSLQGSKKWRNNILLKCGDIEKNPGPTAQGTRRRKSDPKKMLHVVHLNTRSLLRHFDDVACLVSSVHPEVLALSVTWLDSSVGDGELYLPGYTLFRCDRSRCGGGVAVYCADHLSCSVLSCGPSSSGVEYIWASIDCRLFSSPLVLGCFYRPPSLPSQSVQDIYYVIVLNK